MRSRSPVVALPIPLSSVLLAVAIAAGVVALSTACRRESPAPASPAPPLCVAVLPSLAGVFEPCGCHDEQLGGLARIAALQAELAAEGPCVWVASGDTLIDGGHDGSEQADADVAFVASSLHRIGVRVFVPGPADRALGRERLRNLLANPDARIERAGAWFVLPGSGGRVQFGVDAVDQEARLMPAIDVRTSSTPGLAAPEVLVELVEAGPRATLIGGGRGQHVVVFRFRGPSEITAESVPIDDRHPISPEWRRRLDAHYRTVSELNRRTGGTEGSPAAHVDADAPRYVGSPQCAACHTLAFSWWLRSAHGRAYETLQRKNRHLDLKCVGCHVTGYREPGGATLLDVQGRTGVGCESCHGPGGSHVQNPRPPHRGLRKSVSTAQCVACHDAKHSPAFEEARARRALMARGHGLSRVAP